jgi:hypothetical protein
MAAVAHSPTPSIVRIAASRKGDGKNALAAWDSWCSAKSSCPYAELLAYFSRGVKLFLHPEGAGLQEGWKAPGSNREVCLEDTFELEQRLVVEAHKGKIRFRD